MVLLNEFIIYLIKFIILGLVAFAGIMCAVLYKKRKNAKEENSSNEKNI